MLTLQVVVPGFFMFEVLIHFRRLAFFYTPSTREKTIGLLIFSGGTEKDQWHEMGKSIL